MALLEAREVTVELGPAGVRGVGRDRRGAGWPRRRAPTIAIGPLTVRSFAPGPGRRRFSAQRGGVDTGACQQTIEGVASNTEGSFRMAGEEASVSLVDRIRKGR